MTKRTYSRPITVWPFKIFGSVSMLLLCTVCFFMPFALRGAKLALQDMQNNVADWLPDDYVETVELKEFSKYFDGGDRFLVLTGPWCKEGNSTYESLLKKIRAESLEHESSLRASGRRDELTAHRIGDEYALLFADKYHEDWGEQREKWLQGRNGQWYFITRDGSLFRWEGQNNVIEGASRMAERMRNGKNKVEKAFFIRKFGDPPTDKPNEYYDDPLKLCCRPFKSVITGPEVLEQMAGPEGTLRIGKGGEAQEKSSLEAKIEAHKRLTGSLFGPTPSPDFDWTFSSLLQVVDQAKRDKLMGVGSDAPEKEETRNRESFKRFVDSKVQEDYDGDLSKLCDASRDDQLELWYRMWFDLGIEAPSRQTSLIVTLNEPVLNELARVIGRPILGKPRGRLLELAIGICGISPENVRVGGPPSDNVAIDEEGTNTLVRLAGLSLIIGITLAYLSFSSIRVACMLFFVGGMSAIASLSYVWFGGSSMDAILMSMPSLVYVLGLSSAVHIVNYYRDACHESGPDLAVEKAVSHSWIPCSIAAFTTSLGLFSLCMSSLTPINKFGYFSGIAVMATVILLFAYLPSALYVWPPGYDKKTAKELAKESGITAAVTRFWAAIGNWVVGNHWLVTVASVAVLIYFAVGVTRIETSVQLLKLFDSDAKILHDYRWIEDNLGKLVPAEIAAQIELDAQQEPAQEAYMDKFFDRVKDNYPEGTTREEMEAEEVVKYDDKYLMENELRFSMLERVELSRRIRQKLERYFGPDGMGIVGSGTSMDVFTPLYQIESQLPSSQRILFSKQLWRSRKDMLEQDYHAISGVPKDRTKEVDPNVNGAEIWRVSIRLAALNNVDYGQFVNDLKSVVEPIMTGYAARTNILKTLQEELQEKSLKQSRVLVLARDPDLKENKIQDKVAAGATISELIDQTYIFSDTVQDLLENRGIAGTKNRNKRYVWADPDKFREKADKINSADFIKQFDCVILVEDDPVFDLNLIQANTKARGAAGEVPVLLDFRDHRFVVNPETKLPAEGMLTAKEKLAAQESGVNVSAMYTGIVPIVYKAQRSLLKSLIESIGLAFVMISVVMMLLLRPRNRPTAGTLLNFRGGMISMLPNMFPVIVVFGFMGHMNRYFGGSVDAFLVDIGSMMTASVAMGVAVDDTIHFLNWYRGALANGYDRRSAIKISYDRVATAMTQTTLIGGFGLSAFALSTFTPTQRFGVLMLILLGMALIGDLILLPALIAGPFGKYFGKERPGANPNGLMGGSDGSGLDDQGQPTLRLVEGDAPANPSVDLPDVVLPPPEAM